MRALKSTNDFNNAHWFMPSDKKKCYSYIRWSSDKQSGGSTLARQLKTAKEIADDEKLELIEMVDSGISAFKGKNAKDGALGRFIDAVENKLIPDNSWLVVENLDRISREDIMSAQRLFMTLLELGITVVTGMDKKAYNKQIVTDNPMDLMYSIMLFARAHEESKTKSKRTYGNALSIIEKYNNGERSVDGYAIAIKSVGANMWFSDCSDGSVKKHPIYFPIAQEIISLAIDKGMGSHSIVRYLNSTYPNILPKVKNNKNGSWSLNRISQFFKSESLFGIKKFDDLDGQDYILRDYYPPLCDEDTFYKIRSMRKGRNVKPEHTDKVYLFLGRDIIKCGHCGAKMTSHTSNANKEKGKYDKFRYKCASGQNATGKCRAWTFNAIWLDHVIVALAANHVFRPLHKSKDLDLAIKGLEENLIDKKQQIDNLLKVIMSGVTTTAIPKQIAELEAQVEQLTSSIETGKSNRANELTETVEWGEVDERVLDYHQHELRQRLKDKIRLSVKQVICQQVKAKLVKFTITFINDITIVAYRTPMTLVFDGIAWAKLGDHYKGVVPLSKAEQFNNKIEGDSTPIDEDVLKKELGDLAEFIIDAPADNIGENENYEYQGLDNVSPEMMTLLKTGEQPKELLHDLTRAEHLADWADGFSKDVPKVIESQFTTFKHKYNSHLGHKAKPAILYIDEVQVGLSGSIKHDVPVKNSNK